MGIHPEADPRPAFCSTGVRGTQFSVAVDARRLVIHGRSVFWRQVQTPLFGLTPELRLLIHCHPGGIHSRSQYELRATTSERPFFWRPRLSTSARWEPRRSTPGTPTPPTTSVPPMPRPKSASAQSATGAHHHSRGTDLGRFSNLTLHGDNPFNDNGQVGRPVATITIDKESKTKNKRRK